LFIYILGVVIEQKIQIEIHKYSESFGIASFTGGRTMLDIFFAFNANERENQ